MVFVMQGMTPTSWIFTGILRIHFFPTKKSAKTLDLGIARSSIDVLVGTILLELMIEILHQLVVYTVTLQVHFFL